MIAGVVRLNGCRRNKSNDALVKKLFARVGAGPEAQASGYPNEALTGWWAFQAGFEPASFG